MSRRIGVINDLHIPFHDKKAVDLTLDIFQDIKIDKLILNGDIVDFINLSLHGPKHPEIKETVEDEINQTLDFLKNLRKRFPKIQIVFLFGNHEDRLDRWIMQKCPSFWNLLRLDKMLQLEQLDIEWYPYNYEYQVYDSNLYVQHSPPSYSQNAAMTCLKMKMDASYIYACTHRRDYAIKTGKNGRYEVFCSGWLGSTKQIDHLHNTFHKKAFSYTKGHENWQQMATIVYHFDDQSFEVNQFNIRKDHSAVVEGNYYRMIDELPKR